MILLKKMIGKPPLSGEVLPDDYPKGPRSMPLKKDKPKVDMKPKKPKKTKPP